MGCGGENRGKESPRLEVMKKGHKREQRMFEAKIILLGHAGVGKSSIATRYIENKFLGTYEVTIGGAYLQKHIMLADGTQVKLHIWDTGGADRFRSMTHMYYKEAVGAIFVFDLTNHKSFDVMKYWMEDLEAHEDSKRIVLALSGNKCDIPTESKQLIQKAKEYANTNNMFFKITSAATGEGVQELFKELIEAIANKKLKEMQSYN